MGPIRSTLARVGLWLGGAERLSGEGLPVEEFAHPYPLCALALLGINDHLLKGSGLLPGWLTGKLSDFAGLYFFPLFVTAAVDTLGFAAFRLSGGRGPDYSLRRVKLLAAVGLTAALFIPIQLSTTWAERYIALLQMLDVFDVFGHFAVVPDPTDLVALPMLALAYRHGAAMVQRVPIGRLRVLRARIARAPEAAQALTHRALSDVARRVPASGPVAAAWAALIEALPRALSAGAKSADQARADRALAAYRRALGWPVPTGGHR